MVNGTNPSKVQEKLDNIEKFNNESVLNAMR